MSTPVVTGFVFTNKDSPETDKEKIEIKDMQVLYQKLVGKLGYIVTWGRPDLALARSKLGKFAKNPDSKHGGPEEGFEVPSRYYGPRNCFPSCERQEF